MPLATHHTTIAPCFVRKERPARTLVISPHPDDEIVGLAGHLSWLAPSVTIVHVTDGVPPWADASLASVREQEARAALSLARVPFDALVRLHFGDQRVAEHVIAVTERVRDLIALYEPELVMTTPFEGGHPDHDACALAVASAVKDTRIEHWEWASYHADKNGALFPGVFLDSPNPVDVVELSAEAAGLKKKMLACHASQKDVLTSFPVVRERFRRAPRYDFSARPAPVLFYETRPWNVTFASWRTSLKL